MKTAIDHHPRRAKLGDILVKFDMIRREQLESALKEMGSNQKNLDAVLVKMGLATEQKISKAEALRLDVPFFTTFDGMIEPGISRLVPETVARKLLAAPIFKSEDGVIVAMINPVDIHAIDEIARHSGLRVHPVMTTWTGLFDAIQREYRRKKSPGTATSAGGDALETRAKDAVVPAVDDSAVEVVNGLLQEGMAHRASDIHMESAEKKVRVRFRVDGMLQNGKTYAKDMEAAMVARVKIMAKLDITETRLPQDGSIRFKYGGRGIDVRVSTIPTVHGEKVVMRLLDSTKSLRKMTELGLEGAVLSSFSEAARSPNGLILVTGPTGSGKTTTLYAAITELNKADRNIVTLENPVEYVIDQVNQMEAFPKIGLTFAAGLRAILRQDPNVILVGEIRDLETAEIAMQASITGHLVFSTLHTNDSVSSIHRLLNMRVEPFMIAGALRGVLAQRLLRRLCVKCKRPHKATEAETKALGGASKIYGKCFEPVGCPACFESGYSGRIAAYEWLSASRLIRDLIMKKASIDELRAAAESEGMKSLRQSGLEKVWSGETSLEEVLRMTRVQSEA